MILMVMIVRSIYYRGKLIIERIIKQLYFSEGLDKSTDIVISGESAGGLAVFFSRGCY